MECDFNSCKNEAIDFWKIRNNKNNEEKIKKFCEIHSSSIVYSDSVVSSKKIGIVEYKEARP